MRRHRHRWCIPALLVLATACASTGGMVTEPVDVGTERTFDRDYPDVLRAARSAVTGAGLTIQTDSVLNDSTQMIVGTKGVSAWSWGELVRVVVQGTGPSRAQVHVLTKRKMATNITAKGDYSTTIFTVMADSLR
jgi:hypothetical protein